VTCGQDYEVRYTETEKYAPDPARRIDRSGGSLTPGATPLAWLRTQLLSDLQRPASVYRRSGPEAV
jgi:hypothetical protein